MHILIFLAVVLFALPCAPSPLADTPDLKRLFDHFKRLLVLCDHSCPMHQLFQLMAVGVSGVNGVFALNQWMAYKPGTETVSTRNQNVVVTPAMDPELL